MRKNKIIILLIVVLIFVTTIVASRVVNAWMVKKSLPIYSVDTKDKKISITFDINWTDEDNLGSILDIMKEYNVKGSKWKENPSQIYNNIINILIEDN